MKTLAFFMLLAFFTECKAQDKRIKINNVNSLCTNGKYTYKQAGDIGWILHIRCPKYDGGNIFILLENNKSESGILLDNPSRFKESGKAKLKLESAGSKFFLVKIIGQNGKYKYSFIEGRWIYLKALEVGQSTKERE